MLGPGWWGRADLRRQGTVTRPVAGSGRERILAIDVVRGLAVVGMLLVNNAGIPAAMPQALRTPPGKG
jgi:uncharacterized membrane protein YeiB